MSDALLLLRLEHSNLSQLLDLIDEQCQLVTAGREFDLGLLETVTEYFSGYPDKCHHPVEDLVFQRLKMRDPAAVSDPDKLADEHADIERLTASLSQAISGAGGGNTAGLADTMQRFVTDYREHMAMEEDHFFPAAAKALSEQDWNEIDFKLFDNPDPLFDPATHKRFHVLRERINSLAQDSHKRTRRLRELRQAGKFSSVEEFNEFLEAADYAYRLESKPAGGYTVITGSQKLIDIPDCAVAQAIRCAYFFVQGLEDKLT